MQRPAATIIVPVYNTEKYLERAIDSILAQSVSDFELILVDDGSTDGSGNICEKYACDDARIKIVYQENQGVSVARNTGLNMAAGRYILFVDSDDELPPDALELLIGAVEKHGCEMAIGDCDVIGENQKFSYLNAVTEAYTSPELTIEMMIVPKTKWLMSAVWGKLFLCDTISEHNLKFSIELINGEDGMFIVDYLSHINNVINVGKIVYKLYRYDEEERISAVSAFYYDFYDFYLMHSENLWRIARNHISMDMEKVFYRRFLDGMISYLIHAVAYKEHLAEKSCIPMLNRVMENEMVAKAIKAYKRSDPSTSILIPFFMRTKCVRLLYLAIELRVKRYWKTHARAKLIKSVYFTGSL